LGLSVLRAAGIVSWSCDGTHLGCPVAGCGGGLSIIVVSIKSQDVVEEGVPGEGDQIDFGLTQIEERAHGPLRLLLFSTHLRPLSYIMAKITTGGSIICQNSNSPMFVRIYFSLRLVSKRYQRRRREDESSKGTKLLRDNITPHYHSSTSISSLTFTTVTCGCFPNLPKASRNNCSKSSGERYTASSPDSSPLDSKSPLMLDRIPPSVQNFPVLESRA
jgi:hypothetical protein